MSDTYPKISIVTPTYNQGAFIEETIQSVLNQNYPNLEFIIIDGGSKDGTVDIIKQYEQHLTYWISEPDKGQSDAINKGLAKCTGRVFNWLNSDDLLEEGALLAIGQQFNNPNVSLVTGTTNIKQFETGEVQPYVPELQPSLAKTISRPCLHQPSTFVLTDNIKRFGGVSSLLHYAMDMEMYTKYLLELGQEGVVVLDRVIATFRIHNQSKTGTAYEIFIKDIASVYHSMALQKGMNALADKIMLISNRLQVEDYRFEYDLSKVDDTLIQSILENYVYKYVNMLYDGNLANMKKSKALLNNFAGEQLLPTDKAILEKIRKRVDFVYFSWLVKKAAQLLGR